MRDDLPIMPSDVKVAMIVDGTNNVFMWNAAVVDWEKLELPPHMLMPMLQALNNVPR